MPSAPPLYQKLAAQAAAGAKAEGGVVLFIFNGAEGNAVAVMIKPALIALLPQALRDLANDLERDFPGRKGLDS